MGIGGCASSETARAPGGGETSQKTMKQQVFELLRSIETGVPAPIASINPDQYTQHNLGVADGLAGFGAVLHALPPGSARARPVRVFADGELVFAHTEYDFFGPKIGFDIFRFEDGRIVEHWDNLQETPSGPNPSGHSMIDGPTEATDLDQTEANKALVRGFMDDVLVNGRMDRLASYFDGDSYVQHNPTMGDGLSGLGAGLRAMAEAGITMTFERVHRVLGEGSFVLVVSEGTLAGTPTAFYDLFRVAGGRIAEHWDTIQAIPPREQWR
ncbi:MAG: hypothetical protein CVU23_11350, partial [Betaproteobacteria bacterium HGW-Betaproteobacteria-17]